MPSAHPGADSAFAQARSGGFPGLGELAFSLPADLALFSVSNAPEERAEILRCVRGWVEAILKEVGDQPCTEKYRKLLIVADG